jgi:hypothetical protein
MSCMQNRTKGVLLVSVIIEGWRGFRKGWRAHGGAEFAVCDDLFPEHQCQLLRDALQIVNLVDVRCEDLNADVHQSRRSQADSHVLPTGQHRESIWNLGRTHFTGKVTFTRLSAMANIR